MNRSRLHRAELSKRDSRAATFWRFRLARRTLNDYAKEAGVSLRTASNDRAYFMAKANEVVVDLAAKSREEMRAEKREEFAALRASLHNPNIRDDRKILLALEIIDRECKLDGLNAAEKVEISGPTLNPLYLAIAKALVDVSEEDIAKVLDFAASLVRPITLDATCFPPIEPLQLEGDK